MREQNAQDEEGCKAAITSEDYVDVLVRYREADRIMDGNSDICYQVIDNSWVAIYLRLGMVPFPNFKDYDYYPIPKLYGLMERSSMVESGILEVQNQTSLNLLGRNVIIGFVDTGIDYLHSAFKDATGKTRIYSIWDQTDNNGTMPDGFFYGSEYSEAQINAAIESDNPLQIVPQQDEPNGHGTFLAGIAAGSDLGSDFTGAAPESNIIMVKLRPAKRALRDFFLINEDAVAYSESDIMLGIRYLYEKSLEAGKPLVICLGLGTSYGPHAVGTPLTQMLSDISDMAATVVVLPTGNEGNSRHHYLGKFEDDQDYVNVEVRVGENERGFVMELWGQQPDIYSVEIIAPSGEIVRRMPARNEVNYQADFIYEPTVINIDYRLVENINGNQLIAMRFDKPSSGIWQIRVYNDNLLAGYFNMWLPISEFLSSDTYFINSSPYVTLTMPSASYYPIAVSAYDHRDNSIWIDSGRGYSADGIIKPDIAAPGVLVYGPRAGGSHDGFGRRSGTSVAAAHVAGAAALLLEWEQREGTYDITNTSDIKALMILGAQRDRNRFYPNPEWGFGRLNVASIFEKLSGT